MENMKNNEYSLKKFYQSPANIYLFKSTIKTLEKGAKYVKNKNIRTRPMTLFWWNTSVSIFDFEQAKVSWEVTDKIL